MTAIPFPATSLGDGRFNRLTASRRRTCELNWVEENDFVF